MVGPTNHPEEEGITSVCPVLVRGQLSSRRIWFGGRRVLCCSPLTTLAERLLRLRCFCSNFRSERPVSPHDNPGDFPERCDGDGATDSSPCDPRRASRRRRNHSSAGKNYLWHTFPEPHLCYVSTTRFSTSHRRTPVPMHLRAQLSAL